MNLFITRYITRSLIITLFFVLAFLISAIWLTQSLRYLSLIITSSVSFLEYFRLLLYLVPELIPMLLPLAVLISVFSVYMKMKDSYELTVLQTSGMSPFKIAVPAILVAQIAVLASLSLNIWIIPQAVRSFKDQEHILRNQFSSSLIQPGTMNVFNQTVIFVKNSVNKNELKNIFIHSSGKKPYTIIAQEGEIIKSPQESKYFLKLVNGVRQEVDQATQKITEFYFEELNYDLSTIQSVEKERVIKPSERELGELLFTQQNDTALNFKLKAEGHQRIITPFMILIFALIPINFILLVPKQRKKNHQLYALGGLIPFFIHLVTISFLNMNHKVPFAIPLTYCMVFCVISFNLVLLGSDQALAFFKKRMRFFNIA